MINLIEILKLLFGSFFLFTIFALLALYYGFQSRNLYHFLLLKYVQLNTNADNNKENILLLPNNSKNITNITNRKNIGNFELVQDKIPNFIFSRHPIIVTFVVSSFIIVPFAFGVILMVSFRSLTISGFNLASLLVILLLIEIIFSTKITSLIKLAQDLIRKDRIIENDFSTLEKTLFLLKSREKQFFVLFMVLELIAVFFDFILDTILYIISNTFFNEEVIFVLQSAGNTNGGVSIETVLMMIIGLYLIPRIFFTFAIKLLMVLSKKFLKSPFESKDSELLLPDFKQKYIIDGQNIIDKRYRKSGMFWGRSTSTV
ncbi:MAG: hypothetical protein HeimC3_28580 [Candidatus Heimdallarchaeota archaeon LC_3]|nr:MAG: hypothetical protein HeimC3_28580 [Candidatus Heimdallarchaeota archaeon LC_3]